MSDEIVSRHTAAEQIAAEAGALALDFFNRRSDLITEFKASPQDVVSQADRQVENLVRQRISALFPDDGLLGEEQGLLAGASGFTWVIDPIDGTTPFLAGLPHWCVAIALVQNGATVAAVTQAPIQDEVYSARRGAGAWLNGKRLAVDGRTTLENSLTGIGANHRTSPDHVAGVIRGLLIAGGAFYRSGSGALMLAAVAAGRLGTYYEPYMNCWDCLGGLLMVEEAGGTVKPFGSPNDLRVGGPVLASAPAAWEEINRIIAVN